MKRTTIFALATLAALSVSATSIDAKPDAVAAWVGDSVPALYATGGNNPALRSFAHPYGLTILGIDYGTMRRDSIIAPQLGRGFDRYGVGASTYTRVGSDMVLEGHASYHRGTTRDVVWNETADIFMIYPYMAADSVGGDIQTRFTTSEGRTATVADGYYGASRWITLPDCIGAVVTRDHET